MKEYKPFTELKEDAIIHMQSLNHVINLASGMLSEDGLIIYEVYDYISSAYYMSDNPEDFLFEISRMYREFSEMLEKLTNHEKTYYYNSPKIAKLIRRYVIHNYPLEERETYPEFIHKNENA